MRLVKQHTNVPAPDISLHTMSPERGSIGMSLIPGLPLTLVWDGLDERNKEWVYCEIWFRIAQW